MLAVDGGAEGRFIERKGGRICGPAGRLSPEERQWDWPSLVLAELGQGYEPIRFLGIVQLSTPYNMGVG